MHRKLVVLSAALLAALQPMNNAKASGLCTVQRCTELGICYINSIASRCAYESHGSSLGALVFPHGTFYLEKNTPSRKWSVVYGKKQEFTTLGFNRIAGNWNILRLDDGVIVKYPLLPFQR